MVAPYRDEKLAFKYAKIKTDLSIQILEGRLKAHARIPSLNEITDTYDVSKITARRVLNDLVSEGLVYAVRGRGSFVADRSQPGAKTNAHPAVSANIGVVFEHAIGEFISDIIRGIDTETYKRGVHINLCLSNSSFEREAEMLGRLSREGIRKILLFMVESPDEDGMNVNLPLYLGLQQQGIQLLLIGCTLAGVPIPSVSWDDQGGMRDLVLKLHEKGCKDLVYVTRVTSASSNADRFAGFKDGLLESGLKYRPERILRIPRTTDEMIIENSRRALLDFLATHPSVDAVLCTDEVIASGVFDALEQTPGYGLDRVRVGGFGNTSCRVLLKGRPYYLLQQDTHQLGCLAAQRILSEDINEGAARGAGNGSGAMVWRQLLPVPLIEP